jgi:hypothetical protein
MRNVVPARALRRRSGVLLFGAGFLAVLGILAIAIGSFLATVHLVVADNPNYAFYVFSYSALPWLGFILITIAVLMVIRALTWKQDNPIAASAGQVLANELNLDDRYSYIRNVSKASIGYVDAVLVGPPGILVFRVTERAGTYFNQGAKWMVQKDKGQWQALNWSPSKEVVDDIRKIREFLQTKGLAQIPIFGVVMFTEAAPATRVTTENPSVPVLQPQELAYGLEDSYFAQRDRLDQLTVNKIAETLYH